MSNSTGSNPFLPSAVTVYLPSCNNNIFSFILLQSLSCICYILQYLFLCAVNATTELNMDNLIELLECLWSARSCWHNIGIALKIDVPTLEVIKQDHDRTDDCFREVIQKWLRDNKSKSCWKLLAEALSSRLVGVMVKEKSKSCFIVIILTVMLFIIIIVIVNNLVVIL